MNKPFLAVLSLFLIFPSLSHAQSVITMRSLAADQLFIYGQAVYDRGQYSEAAAVFSKILSMDPSHAEALKYAQSLKEKGERVFIPAQLPVKKTAAVVKKEAPVKIQKAEPVYEPVQILEPNEVLKQNIQLTDQAIEKIKDEISHLRMQVSQEQQGVKDKI